MFSYVWPIALIVVANTVYNICAKSVSPDIDPLASLVVTYGVATVFSAVMYFITARGDAHIIQEVGKINFASIIMGLSVVGLEGGFIYAFRAGWPLSTTQIVQSSLCAIILILVSYFAFNESFNATKAAGIAICLVGLYLINK